MNALLDRVPPQSEDAEQSVLGSMLLDRDAIAVAAEVLRVDDFYRDSHKTIFEAVMKLYDRNEAADLVTLTNLLESIGQLEDVGGVSYLSSLANAVPTSANIEYYARIVEQKAVLRRLIKASAEITRLAYSAGDASGDVLDRAEQIIFDIARTRITRSYAPLNEVLKDAFEEIEKLYQNKGSIVGVPTGFKRFDELTSGLHPSELIIVAARPSVGKTTLAMNMAAGAAIKHQVPVAIFSLEMSREQLALRLLSSEAKIDGHRLRTGYLQESDWPKLSRALGRLGDVDFYIDDTPNMSIMELRGRARRLSAERNIGLVVIDYMQLMHTSTRTENRQQEMSEISRSLKQLARELKCPVLALSQLSRAVEQRSDRRPQLSDLRESGAIEQDADVVAFIWKNPERDNDNVLDIIVAKQRNGPTGDVPLIFMHKYSTFVEPTWRENEG